MLSNSINNQNREYLEPKSVVIHIFVAIFYILCTIRSEAIINLHDLLDRDIIMNELLLNNLLMNADTDYIEVTNGLAFSALSSG